MSKTTSSIFPTAICAAAKTAEETTAQSQYGKIFVPLPIKIHEMQFLQQMQEKSTEEQA